MLTVVYGGSFNPFGRHHLAAAMWIAADPEVQRVLVVPAAAHATKTYQVDFQHRLALVKASLPQDSKLVACDIEQQMIERGHEGAIYTYDLLSELRQLYPGNELRFAIGPDLIDAGATWYKGKEVEEEFGFYQLPDAGPGRSTTIRRLIAQNDRTWQRYMTDRAVTYLKDTAEVLQAYRGTLGPVAQSFDHS